MNFPTFQNSTILDARKYIDLRNFIALLFSKQNCAQKNFSFCSGGHKRVISQPVGAHLYLLFFCKTLTMRRLMAAALAPAPHQMLPGELLASFVRYATCTDDMPCTSHGAHICRRLAFIHPFHVGEKFYVSVTLVDLPLKKVINSRLKARSPCYSFFRVPLIPVRGRLSRAGVHYNWGTIKQTVRDRAEFRGRCIWMRDSLCVFVK